MIELFDDKRGEPVHRNEKFIYCESFLWSNWRASYRAKWAFGAPLLAASTAWHRIVLEAVTPWPISKHINFILAKKKIDRNSSINDKYIWLFTTICSFLLSRLSFSVIAALNSFQTTDGIDCQTHFSFLEVASEWTFEEVRTFIRHVPGSAEAHGGLQKTHLLRKEASSSTDSAFCMASFFKLLLSHQVTEFNLHQPANSCWLLKIKSRNKTSLKCVLKRRFPRKKEKKKAVNVHVKYFSVCSCMTFLWGLKDLWVWFVILHVVFIYLYFSTLTWRYNNNNSAK